MSCPEYYSNIIPLSSEKRSNEELACLGIRNDGTTMSLQEWTNYWANISGTHLSCTTIFDRIIHSGDNFTNGFYSKDGFLQVMNDFDYMFSKLYSNFNLNEKSFENVLIDACSNPEYNLQGVCQNVSSFMCSNCNVNQVTNDRKLIKLCGCSVRSLPNNEIYSNITAACDPLCSHEQVSKKRDIDTGIVDQCNATVCVINNIGINVSESTVGSANFTQVCPQCQGTISCRCIIDSSIPSITSKVGISTNFNQYCGNNSVCIKVNNTTGETEVVPCNTEIKEIKYPIVIPFYIWIIIVIILILFILIVTSAIYAGKHQRVEIKKDI